MKVKAPREPAASAEERAEMEALAACVGPLTSEQIALFTRLFSPLLARHRGALTTLLWRWRLAADEREDVSQVVLLDAFNVVCAEGFAGREFDAILRGCFRSKISNYLRNRVNRRETALPTSSAEQPRSLGSEERGALLLAALNSVCEGLSDLEFTILDLVLIRRVPHTEAADLLGITPGALKACVARLRALLAEAIGEVEDAS